MVLLLLKLLLDPLLNDSENRLQVWQPVRQRLLDELPQVLHSIRAIIFKPTALAFFGRGVSFQTGVLGLQLRVLLLLEHGLELGPFLLADVELQQIALLFFTSFQQRDVLEVFAAFLDFSCKLRWHLIHLGRRPINFETVAHGRHYDLFSWRILVVVTGVQAGSVKVDDVDVLNVDEVGAALVHGCLRLNVIIFEQRLLVFARQLPTKITSSTQDAGFDLVILEV